MKKLATLQATAKTKGNSIHGIANSLTESRDGTIVTQKAGEEALGRTVPLLLSHNWDALPVGSVTMESVDEDGLHYTGQVFDSAPNKEQLLEGISSGVLAVSVGFLVQSLDEEGGVSSMDLLELSITPVPADSRATVTQELKLENFTEDHNMEKDENNKDFKGKKKVTQAGDTAADNSTDTATNDEQPTLADLNDKLDKVSTSINALADAFAKAFPDDADPADGKAADDKTTAQALDNYKERMLQSMSNEPADKYTFRQLLARYDK